LCPTSPCATRLLKQIIRLKLGKIQRRLDGNHKVALSMTTSCSTKWPPAAPEVESGARNVDNILSNTMLPESSRQILTQLAGGGVVQPITVSVATAR